jgi:hypothetical protein
VSELDPRGHGRSETHLDSDRNAETQVSNMVAERFNRDDRTAVPPRTEKDAAKLNRLLIHEKSKMSTFFWIEPVKGEYLLIFIHHTTTGNKPTT